VNYVLGLARSGLILTRSQQGTQAGRLTQFAKQNSAFDTMCHHAGFWMGKLARGVGGKLVRAQEHSGHWSARVAQCIQLFVL